MGQTAQAVQTPPKVVIKKIVAAPRERVYDAWTKPELMQKWFFARSGTAKTRNDLRVGGSYTHTMIAPAGDCGCDSQNSTPSATATEHVMTGEYLVLRRPEQIVFTWNNPLVQNTRVTIDLHEQNGATEITITHELLETEELRQRHAQGWEACLQNLATTLG